MARSEEISPPQATDIIIYAKGEVRWKRIESLGSPSTIIEDLAEMEQVFAVRVDLPSILKSISEDKDRQAIHFFISYAGRSIHIQRHI